MLYPLQSDLLTIPHGMFDRNNGASLPPFDSLNVSYSVSDNTIAVTANRQRIKKVFNISFLLSARQIHSSKIFNARIVEKDNEVDGFDALITNQKNVGLLIQQADCQAILMHDPIRNAIAAIHCGWRGSVANIINTTVLEMHEQYKTDPSHLNVVISPSLGPCCAEFINYTSELSVRFHPFQEKTNHFNFWDISVMQLEEAGVKPTHIDVTGICTCCNSNYFSYRRTRKNGRQETGRNCSLICLPQN